MPTISVIVPVYNTEKYLHRCIDSILAQTFTDFELLLVDDGSTDSSGTICDEYAAKNSRVRVFHQENQGQAAARNHALDWMFANSDSQYISFIDSDDWVHHRYLELLLEGTKGVRSMCVCKLRLFTSNEEIQVSSVTFAPVNVSPEFVYTHGTKQIYTYTCGILFEKSLWEKERFPEGIKWEDLCIFHRLLFAASNITWIDYDLYYYFQNTSGTVFSEWNSSKIDYIRVLQQLIRDPQIMEHPVIFEAVKATFLHSLIRRISFLEKKEKENRSEYSIHLNEHRKALRRLLFRFRKDYIFTSNKYCYQLAYPRLMWLYWTCAGVAGKVKRVMKKCR